MDNVLHWHPPHLLLARHSLGRPRGCLEAPAASEAKHLPQPAALLSSGRASAFSLLTLCLAQQHHDCSHQQEECQHPTLARAMGTAWAMPASPRREQVPLLTAGQAGAVHRGHPQVGGAGVEEHEELLGRRADGDGADVLSLPWGSGRVSRGAELLKAGFPLF